jgi:hypothetical protein
MQERKRMRDHLIELSADQLEMVTGGGSDEYMPPLKDP